MSKKKKGLFSGGALAALGGIPRISSGGTFALGYSYQHALAIAVHTISSLSENRKNTLLESLYGVFERWKNELGVYPPIWVTAQKNDIKQMSAKQYIRQAREAAILKEEPLPKYLKPWECSDFANTPAALFLKLYAENYTPLNELLTEHDTAFEHALATAIIMTHNPDGNDQSADSIQAAFLLARFQLLGKSSATTTQANLKRKLLAEDREKNIVELHQSYLSENSKGLPYKTYSYILTERFGKGYSESTISRVLTRNGFKRYTT